MRVGVVGASGGIGAAIVEQLAARDDVERVFATYWRTPAESVAKRFDELSHTKIQLSYLDASDEPQIKLWLESIGAVDWLINSVGFLHNENQGPEKSILSVNTEHFMASMAVNCLPTLLLAKHAKASLKHSERPVFATVSARVGSIADNRLGGWYSYRASKAALNMALKSLSIEWSRTFKAVRVAALHPGTTDSSLSKPFQKNVPEGKLFAPPKTANLLITQIERLHDGPSGRFIAYDGQDIPW